MVKDNKYWITKSGQAIAFCDMTDAHLGNALAYSVRQSQPDAVMLLEQEVERRAQQKFYARTIKCQWCGEPAPVAQVEEPPEVGWSIPGYQFVCGCGAASPIFTKEEILNGKHQTKEPTCDGV